MKEFKVLVLSLSKSTKEKNKGNVNKKNQCDSNNWPNNEQSVSSQKIGSKAESVLSGLCL